MAQSALTVTPPSPSPPTNFSSTGVTGPNPPNYSKTQYAEPFGDLDASGNWTGTSLAPGDRKNPNPPPFYDDGSAGALSTFATNTGALVGGTGASGGGTEGTYPGVTNGVVPASTSVAHEGAGTEVVLTTTYPPAYSGAQPHYPLVTVGAGPVATQATRDAGPNASHPSTLSPATNPTLGSITPGNSVSGVGTTTLGVTGTNFTRQSVIYVNGVAQTTTYVSPTSLTAASVTKKTTSGPWPVTVITAGAVTTAAVTWTFT